MLIECNTKRCACLIALYFMKSVLILSCLYLGKSVSLY